MCLFRIISRNFSLRVKNILGEHKRAELNVDGTVQYSYFMWLVAYRIVVCIKY